MSDIKLPTDNRILEKVAQLWCLPQHSHKEMDVKFAEDIIKLIETENQHLKSQLALCVEALEFLSKIDTAEKAPDFMWLNDWRNNAKILTKECLDKLAAMQSEGENNGIK